MENIKFNISNQKLNEIQSDVSSEPKNQATELVDDELLSNEELVAICGGVNDPGGGGGSNVGINVDIDVAGILGGIYKAGKGLGDSISKTFWNDDRYCD